MADAPIPSTTSVMGRLMAGRRAVFSRPLGRFELRREGVKHGRPSETRGAADSLPNSFFSCTPCFVSATTTCHLSGLAGAATFESSTFECRDLALADHSAQPSCWNMGSYDEIWLPSLACRSYHRFTARLRSAGEAEITAWCQPRGRKRASPSSSSQMVGEAFLTWVGSGLALGLGLGLA